MQSDSMQLSASGHIKEVSVETVTHQSPDKSFKCSKCVLIFKSKVYLFEHLNKVHGLDVEHALRGAGLKSAETFRNSSRSSVKYTKCPHCSFKASSPDDLNEHRKRCTKNEDGNLRETSVVSENSETTLTSTNRHNEATEADEMPSIVSVISLAEAQSTPSSPKDLKTYKRPLQTITKYGTPNATISNETEDTLILQDSPSSSSLNKDGVFKVTATPKIDIDIGYRGGSCRFLQNEHLMVADLESKPKQQLEETPHGNLGTRTKTECSGGPPAKKGKSEDEKKDAIESKSPSKPPSNTAEFSFEVSDEEEESNVNRAPRSPKVYFCKHCDYKHVSFSNVSFHYQNRHPFIRCKAAYIHNPKDVSATYRCLVCPVEFESAIDLKWHYVENHPDAPDVFKMKSTDLGLVFKCFQCPLTFSDSKTLRRHYMTKHPTFEVNKSLFFCKYSVATNQVESPLLETCETTPSPKKTGETCPEKANTPLKEVKSTPSSQHPTCKGSDMAMYKCSKCEFAHKSVVVLHVHYQKNHPDEAMTIPKIKQWNRVASHSTSPPAPLDASEKATDKLELSQQNVSEYKAVVSKNHSASPETKKVQNEEKESERVALRAKPIRKVTAGTDCLPELMYCRFCSYTSTSIKSIVGHHYGKHSTTRPLSKEDILLYSAKVRKKKLKKASFKARRKTVKEVPVQSKPEAECKTGNAAGRSVKTPKAFSHPETLFYCQVCNFANTSVLGVVNHQNKTHTCIKINSEAVIKYTALIRDDIKKSKSLDQGSSTFSHLPLPLISKGDEEKFFCPMCNYRHSTISQLMRHCSVRHRVLNVKASIHEYTSKVLEHVGKLLLKEVKPVEIKETETVESSSASPPASSSDSKSPRVLQCYKCQFSTKYLYLLNNHLWKSHQSKRSVTALLRAYFRKGVLNSGYHCQWCDFSHKEATVVLKHHQQQHPKKKSGLEYVKSHLYVGPDSFINKRYSRKKKPTRHGDGSLTTQSSQPKETEISCSHKRDSESGLKHPHEVANTGLSKDNALDLLNAKKTSARSQVDDLDDMPGLFESFQMPLEDADEIGSSVSMFKCSYCPEHFNTEHGLGTHCRMRHPMVANVEEAQKEEMQQPTRVHVFKCPYCAYINTSYQGVLTHSQMKHPSLESLVKSLHVDITALQNLDKFMKTKDTGGTLKFSGFLCKTCPQVCATLDKLDKHNEQHHSTTKPSSVPSNQQKPAPKPSAVSTITKATVLKSQRSASKALLMSKKASVKCPHCSYSCSTKIALSQHMYIQHKDALSKEFAYKCELCPRFYFTKILLGRHYCKSHGKSAFRKYFVPAYKQNCKKSISLGHPSSLQPEKPSEVRKLVYLCPCCPYVNASYHGTLTHCQMKHPSVLARAERLEKGEILVSNMIGCPLGKGSNERGYMCNKCCQIYASLSKLKIHCKKEHGEMADWKLPAETETQKQPESIAQSSLLEAGSSEQNTAEVTETTPGLSSTEKDQPSSASTQNTRFLYKCQNCSYTTVHRQYLRCHYRKTHKLDAHSTYRLMEKYNMRKCNYLPRYVDFHNSAKVKCKVCPDLTLDSSQLLIDHYNSHHGLASKSDFIVVSLGLKWKSTGVYKCTHCMTVLNGTKILRRHLEVHKKQMMEMMKSKSSPDSSALEPKSTQLIRQDEAHSHQNVTSVETLPLPSSPPLPPSEVTDVEPEVEDPEKRHACTLCTRSFMSLKCLRSHERSHAAMAAIKKDNLPNSQLSIYKYVIHKSGIQKPFRCGCCAYRTNLLGLWRSHFMKKHQDIVQKDDVEADGKDETTQWPSSEISDTSEKTNALPEPDDELEEAERSLYLEPPNVQRQLNQYSLMAHTNTKPNEAMQESALPENSLVHCEICNFKSEHLSSIRRHYLSRHGKKILRCKDCNFFTGLQKTLDVHMETGHSTFQSEPTHQKDLRCPFCLYQTKNKNNMIDHIVLHREERVVPIEVRRPKLSRYLQGIVFRCHQCTFSSGSAENLRLHTMRHDDIKPYKCRLCYFDCTQLSELEAHLTDKHQVLRNHELVGQVCLDQLEARTDISEKHDKNNDSEDSESEEYFTDCDEIPETKNLDDDGEKMSPQAHEEDEQDKNKESPTKRSVFDIQQDHANPSTTIGKEHEKSPEVRPAALHPTVRVQNFARTEDAESLYEDCCDSEEQMNEDKDKHEGSTDENVHDHKPHLKIPHHRILDIEARVEDDILDNILQLDGDGSMFKIHKGTDQKRTDEEQQITETQPINMSIHKRGDVTSDQNPENQTKTNSTSSKLNITQRSNPKPKESFMFERHLLTLSPNYVRLKLSHQDGLGVSFPFFKRARKQMMRNSVEAPELCEQTPALVNDRVEEELACLRSFKQEEETDHVEEEEEDREVDVKTESPEDQDAPHANKDVPVTTDGAAVQHEENQFTCDFCGRNLTNKSELNRHIMRHNM